MPAATVPIRPRHSMAVFAVLAMVMVFLSYAVLLAIAAGCLTLAYLTFRSGSGNLQVLAISIFGIALAGALLWSLVPRRDNFTAPGPLLERRSHACLQNSNTLPLA
jgi:uncharacterized BrkB/YihY/UPF0761 family membrane protein